MNNQLVNGVKYVFFIILFVVTANQTKWDQHDNTTRLDDRITDITKWKISLERCIEATETEIGVMVNFTLTRLLNYLNLANSNIFWFIQKIE